MGLIVYVPKSGYAKTKGRITTGKIFAEQELAAEIISRDDMLIYHLQVITNSNNKYTWNQHKIVFS